MTDSQSDAEGAGLESDVDQDGGFGKAVAQGILVGLPVGVVAMVVIIWMMGDMSLADAFGTGILPGVLFGVFAGGFVGTVRGMRH